MRCRGITLVEVLTVMLIVAILVSIILPMAMGAKDRAKTVVCTSNMHQLYLAMKLYQEDYGEYPPNSVSFSGLKSYYATFLRCPRSTERFPEYDYTIHGTATAGIPQANFDEVRRCIQIRGGDYPLIRDSNHLFKFNLRIAGSFYLFVRENGAFDRVPSSLLMSVSGPCDPSLVLPESNL